ncbi:unnamed protein product [Larinioides sclopetarius]
MELELARLDVERIEELCRKREKERLDRRQKLEDFWFRKAEEQIAWVEKGLELEKKWFEDREAKITWRKTQAIAPHTKRKTPKFKKDKSYENDNRTMDKILKEEEAALTKILKEEKAALTLDEILRESNTVVLEEEISEEEQVEDSKDKSVADDPESFADNDTKKSSSEPFTVSVDSEQKTVTEETQPEQNRSVDEDSPVQPKGFEKLKEEEGNNRAEQGEKNVLEETRNLHENKDLSEKDHFDQKLSLSSSVIQKMRPEEKESEQRTSPDYPNSEQNMKEKGVEEQPSQEIERKSNSSSSDIEKLRPKRKESEQESGHDKSSSEQKREEETIEVEKPSHEVEDSKKRDIMDQPASFILNDNEESKSNEIKQENEDSEKKYPNKKSSSRMNEHD